jgi:hypothetical protein
MHPIIRGAIAIPSGTAPFSDPVHVPAVGSVLIERNRWRGAGIALLIVSALLIPGPTQAQARASASLPSAPGALPGTSMATTDARQFGRPQWRTRASLGALAGCGGVGFLVASNAQKGEKLAAAFTGCALGLVPGAILGVTFLHSAPGVAAHIRVPFP